jgi:hypothetical protein
MTKETETGVPTRSTAFVGPPLPGFAASEVGVIISSSQPCDPYLFHAFPSESMNEPIILLRLSGGQDSRNPFSNSAEL